MKLTWFGASALRIYVGGSIIVVDPEGAMAGIDHAELVAGADRVISLGGDGLVEIEAGNWRPRKAAALIDESDEAVTVEIYRIGERVVLIDAVGEPSVVLIGGEAPAFGRWADDAVVVMLGVGMAAGVVGAALLDKSRPKLIALADADEAVDAAVTALRDKLEGAGLVALERGMAVEV